MAVPEPKAMPGGPRAGAAASAAGLRLSELAVGDRARVAGFIDASAYADSLMRLGLIPGTLLEVRRSAPLGDPVEVRFRGFSLALRPREADCLRLERE